MLHRIKLFLATERIFYILLVTLVAITAYGLGTKAGERTALLQPDAMQPVITFTHAPETYIDPSEKPVVASKSGAKYHYLHCPGIRSIKSTNIIKFETGALAKAAGYSLAGNCTPM